MNLAATRRKLALINLALIAGVVTVVVGSTFFLLRSSLEREANAAIEERAGLAVRTWSSNLQSGQVANAQSPVSSDEDDDDDPLHEALETGDTLVLVYQAPGKLLVNDHQIDPGEVVSREDVQHALDGEVIVRTMQFEEDDVRIRVQPAVVNGQTLGVVAAIRSEREHMAELRLVRNVGLSTLLVGLLASFPVSLWLSGRAMNPVAIAFQRQRAFVADASHELKTPLAVIRAQVDLVVHDPDMSPSQRAADLQDVLAEVDVMAGTIDGLLRLARLDESRQTEAGVANLRDVFAALEREIRPLAQKGALTVTIPDAGDARIGVAPPILTQILRGVLENAIAYTEPGGSIDLVLSPGARMTTVVVRDTGIGIAPDDLPHVFERFYRGSNARSRAVHGSGLGLAMVQAMVTSVGGSIGIASQPGVGTTVTITLPAL